MVFLSRQHVVSGAVLLTHAIRIDGYFMRPSTPILFIALGDKDHKRDNPEAPESPALALHPVVCNDCADQQASLLGFCLCPNDACL